MVPGRIGTHEADGQSPQSGRKLDGAGAEEKAKQASLRGAD